MQSIIKLENVGIAVRDVGRDTGEGEWTDTAVGLDGNHVNVAMLRAVRS